MKRAHRGLAIALFAVGVGLLWPAPGATPVVASDAVASAASAAAAPPPGATGASNVPGAPSLAPVAPLPASDSTACVPGKSAAEMCMGDPDPLAFEKTAVTNLPSARVDVAYSFRFQATGGEPPYVFSEVGHGLPEGLTLDANGNVRGTTSQRGRRTFTVELRDRWGQGVRQQFALNVMGPRTAGPASPAASAPAAIPAIQNVPIVATQTSLRSGTEIDTWRLTEEVLEKIAPPPPPEPADAQGGGTGDAAGGVAGSGGQPASAVAAPLPDADGLDELSEAGASQLATMLKPMLNVDYPTRSLFAAALDARVCAHAAALTERVALDTRQNAPDAEQWRQRCATAWQGPAPKTPPQLSEAPVKWQDLPATLMPARVRAWLIEQAMQPHDATIVTAPPWSGTGCNCLVGPTSGAVYGYVPNWSDPKHGPALDFGLYERLMGYAQPFDDDGNITPLRPDAAQLDFLRAAHRYGSKLDVTIYRRDWQFLLRLPEAQRRRVAEQVARQAVRMIDVPLDQYERRWEDRIPGLASDSHIGDGITLFLDQAPIPGDPRYAAFDDFRHRLIQTLITEMRRGKRHYTLNLMFPAGDLVPALRHVDDIAKPASTPAAAPAKGRPAATPAAAPAPAGASWTFGRLLDYLVQAEDPPYQDGRIMAGPGGYRSQTNVTIRYIVALPEPTTFSKKALREAVEASPDLAGTNRAIVVRRIVPLVSVGSAGVRQMNDDMAYFNDNFGGVALWPQPAADAATAQVVEATVRSTILADETREGAVCNLVCNWRWALRAMFWVLLGVALVSLLLFLFSCRVRALGHPFQLYLAVAWIVPAVIGGLLLRCDPDLASADFSKRLLFAVLAVVFVTMLVPLLKPRVQHP
jgi:hypothetical protein